MPKIDEIDKKAIAEIETIAKKLNLPEDIAASAIELFKSLHKEGFVRGRSAVCVAMACLYHQIKMDPDCLAISLQNFAEKTPCVRKEIYRIYSKLVQKEGESPRVCTLRPTIFVEKFGQKIGFSKRALAGAIRLAEEMVQERVHLGRDPITLAATCLYAAGVKFGEGITQEEIVDGCGVHQVSIRNTLKYPFFVRQKIVYEQIKLVSEEVLSELIPKLLKIKEEGIPFSQLRSELRRSFQDKLKGFSIPYRRLKEAIRELSIKRVVNVTAGSGCGKVTEEAIKINCFRWDVLKPWDFHECEYLYWSPCPYSIIQLREESTPTPK